MRMSGEIGRRKLSIDAVLGANVFFLRSDISFSTEFRGIFLTILLEARSFNYFLINFYLNLTSTVELKFEFHTRHGSNLFM